MMREVANVWASHAGNNVPEPMELMNEEFVERVAGWARFVAEPGKSGIYLMEEGQLVRSDNPEQMEPLVEM